jgi:hypothetical protein
MKERLGQHIDKLPTITSLALPLHFKGRVSNLRRVFLRGQDNNVVVFGWGRLRTWLEFEVSIFSKEIKHVE